MNSIEEQEREDLQIAKDKSNLPDDCLECGAGCGKVERDICLAEVGGLS